MPERLSTERPSHFVLLIAAYVLFAVSGLSAPAAASSFLSPVALGDSVRPARAYQLQATRVRRPPTLDGRLDERSWERADGATGFTQFKPNPGQPASRRTRVYILYDEEAIYVGARLYDDPDSVVARVAQRDDFGYSDRFFVLFDSYNDDRTAFGFGVTPAGSRFDLFFSGGTNQDPDWDAVWSAAARIDSLGWTAELRIPLNQLSFDPVPKHESATWGFNAVRDIARYNERSSWAPLDPTAGRLVSLFGSLRGLRGLPSTSNLEVMPYVGSRATREAVSPANPLHSPTEWSGNVGADLRYGITPNLSLRATVNPDFGQVEADPSKINLTAFETFFPEKRPFFVEGADILSVQGPRLFYSRRIGQEPQGAVPGAARFADAPDRTTILGAAKLTGRTAAGWEIGALEAVTAREQVTYVDGEGARHRAVVAPRTNYGVARLRKNMRGGKSTVGGILTATNRFALPSRLGRMHEAAYAGGLDVRHRFADATYEASGAVYGSRVHGAPEALRATQRAPTHYFQRPDAAHLSFDSTRTRLSGWHARAAIDKIDGRWRWSAELSATSPGFEINDLGYLRSADAVSEELGLTYVNTSPGPKFRQIRGWVRQNAEWTFGRERTETRLSYGAAATLASNYQFGLRGATRLPSLSTTALRGGPALRTDGSTKVGLFVETDSRKAVQAELSGSVRQGLGPRGRGVSVGSELRYRPSPRASLSIEPSVRVALDPTQYVATIRPSDAGDPRYLFGELRRRTLSVTTRASYAFTPEMTLEVYAQPFVASGDYRRFAEVEHPRATHLSNRLDRLGSRLSKEDGAYRVASGPDAGYTFPDPDFTFEQLRSTVVFRWQYRRGSTLHLVWNHETTNQRRGAVAAPHRALGSLFGGGRNTFMVKLNYWLGL
ncbi:MAG: DUF5916 domain-containing protein [Salinibacter sp.]